MKDYTLKEVRQACNKIRQLSYFLETVSYVKTSGQCMSSLLHIRAHAHLIHDHCNRADKLRRHQCDRRRLKAK